jgi:hypothetical protein
MKTYTITEDQLLLIIAKLKKANVQVNVMPIIDELRQLPASVQNEEN